MQENTRVRWVCSLAVGALALVGCGNDVVVGTGGAGGAGSTTSVTNAVATGTTGANMTTGSNTTTGANMTSAVSTSATGGACGMDPNDSACIACSKQNCCMQVTDCAGDMNCACWEDCINTTGDLQSCYAQCGAPDPTAQALAQCAFGSCQMECGGGMTTTSATSSSSTGGGMCPPSPGDTQCVACAKMNCCNQYTACTGDMTCVCWSGCLAMGGNFQTCQTQCGMTDMQTNAMILCATQSCGGQCP